ncbi:MAG: glutamine amidotransferase-related protein, partial [Pseudomonadales bacterium]
FVSRHGDYPEMFRALLSDAEALPPGMAAPEFVDIQAHHGRFPRPDACDGYVITGSRHSVYDPLPWIPPLVDFVRGALAHRRRVVGICFGHQLIAHFFGGETRAADVGWCVGVQEVEVTQAEPWMTPAAPQLALLSSHKDQVVRLPPGARLFARGERCPLAGFVLDDVLTFQGHPEFTNAYAGDLLDMREALLGSDCYQRGKASLATSTDSRKVARWMLNFIGRAAP